ncbi:flagellum site-determining protein YlxH [Paraliobacillus quinghaiensis]|uniref:Flagellum site-determining protein YlxH n=1 Tax=Paraliobacillus quinghaiensis TaxID=470815 RepID=A0A917WQK2_9BACI|nr:MinD/ParA family protein [Paraliobacillus quinghaiensis]GGM21494.1 flagellum site-determining protein YlxH [Paraliobacillus quinghaiensis]
MSDQAANLRKRLEQLHSKTQAKTIAVVSGKGGVGKSNFSLNFALNLSKQRKKVLLFDLDIGMGNIDILLGVQAKQTIVQMFDKQLSIHDIIETGPHSLSYIAAGSGLTDVFKMDESKFTYFLSELEELITQFDYIIFDMGAGASVDSLHYILAVDECIVVTTPEPTSMMDAYAMMKHICNQNQHMPFYLLVNFAENNRDGKQIIKRLQQVTHKFLDKEVLPLGILPNDKIVSKAVTSQIPFILFDPKARITLALEQIVSQYMNDTINLEKQVHSGFIRKLKRFVKER